MPITNATWSKDRGLDLHILRGGSSPDLATNHLAFQLPDGSAVFAADYFINPNNPLDVDLEFVPQIRAVLNAGIYRGGGVQVLRTTGVVIADDPLPPRHLRNFIILAQVLNRADGTRYSVPIRIHIHNAVSQVWLTPETLTIRPLGVARPEQTGFRFSVRVQFDDGVVADVTENHGVTWDPTPTVHPFTGRIFLDAQHVPGGQINVTATLPATWGGASASARVDIAQPWTEPILASIVPGGGWPGTLNPAEAPNFLILGDGFTAADAKAFEQATNSIVHRFKTSHLTTPFDVLSTSINFWRVFRPSSVRGISILCEVFTAEVEGELRAFPVLNAVRPPAAGPWAIDNLIFAAGLPVAADHISRTQRTNEEIRGDWGVWFNPDPSPHVTDEQVSRWRLLGNRSLVEEKNTELGMAYGALPQVLEESDNQKINFHPSRFDPDEPNPDPNQAARRRLDSFLTTLHSDQGHDLTDLWAQQGNNIPTNHDFVLITTVCRADRSQNAEGYIAMSVDDRDYLLGVTTVQGRNAYRWDPPDVPSSISSLRGGRTMHEIAHSFGLGDEYADTDIPFTGTAVDLIDDSNLQAESDTRTGQPGGQIDARQIKWNWFRARKAAVLSGLVTSSGGNRWRVPLVRGQGHQFAVGDKAILRKRQYPHPIRKNPVETVRRDASGVISVLEVAEPLTGDFVTVVGPIDPDLIFDKGDVLYMPTPAPASVRSATNPFAGMIAKNIQDFITSNHRPLTPVPCDPADTKKPEHVPILNGVSLPICFSHKKRIVGLYAGGSSFTCGIFHPAGSCMMHGDKYDSQEFCAVCRFIMVDIIDPSKHSHIDREYDEFYPQK